MSYAAFAAGIFGKFTKNLSIHFLDIREDLHRANMNYTIDEYLSMAILTTVITYISEMFLLSFIFALFIDPILAVPLSFTLSMGLSSFIFFLFYSYPATLSRNRSNKIKKVLPFAISYLGSLASSKLPPITMFKTLATFKEYGEIAKEADTIVRNVELFGMSFSNALKRQAKRTPSAEFSDFLWGLNTISTSGGSMVTYLSQKSNEMMNDYKRRIRKYSQDLSLYVEIYLTLVITGSIFFIVLSSVITTLSGGTGTIALQTFVVFLLLPLLSIGFIVLIKSASPTE
ncbi:type II secretion system F family protein [Candidatus Aenigmatarchaeota archaeon]